MSDLRKALTAHGRVPALLMLYVLLQPALDVLTSLCAEAKLPLTPGTVVRVLFLFCVVCWLVCAKPYAGKKQVLLYGGLVTAYLAAFFAWSMVKGGFGLLLDNAAETLKVFYTLYAALFLYALYRQRGFLRLFKVVGEIWIHKGASLSSLYKSKGNALGRKNAPIDRTLIGGNVNALYGVCVSRQAV